MSEGPAATAPAGVSPTAPQPLPRLERALLVILIAASALLPLLHTFLPMNDAPSHVATGTIAWRLGQGDAFFRAHYSFQLLPLPYWACTLLMLPLEPLVGPLRAFGIVFAAYLIALPLGLRAVLRAVAPESERLVLIGALAAINWAYWLGEVNFLLGQPVALFAFALLLRASAIRSRAFVGFLVLVPILYLCHIFSLTALVICAAGVVAPGLLPERALKRLGLVRPSAAQWIGAFYALAHFALAAYFVLFQHRTDANKGRMTLGLSLHKFGHVAIDPFDTLYGPAHYATPLLWFALIATAGFSLTRRWATMPAELGRFDRALGLFRLPLVLPALGLTLVACLGPAAILNEDGTLKEGEIAGRFALLAVLIGLACLRWQFTPRVRAILLVAVAGFGALKIVECFRIHRAFDQEVKQLDASLLRQIPQHSRVLPLLDMAAPTRIDFTRHRLGSYVVPLRDGYSPHVFATLGQHPLRHAATGDWRGVEELRLSEREQQYYDYVLLQTDKPEAQAPAELRGHPVVGTSGPFRLYRLLRK
jgi:hypothetical protein